MDTVQAPSLSAHCGAAIGFPFKGGGLRHGVFLGDDLPKPDEMSGAVQDRIMHELLLNNVFGAFG